MIKLYFKIMGGNAPPPALPVADPMLAGILVFFVYKANMPANTLKCIGGQIPKKD